MRTLLLSFITIVLATFTCGAQEVLGDSAVVPVITAGELPPLSAEQKETSQPRSYWDHGFGKFLKKIDRTLEEGQFSGIDTMYQTVPKLNRQVYLGVYGYWQNYSNRIPFYFPEALNTLIPGLREGAYYKINAHTHQAEMELGVDWKGLAIEIPIPIRNRYSASYGLAKNGSVWGFRLRYKSISSVAGTKRFGMLGAFEKYAKEHPDDEEIKQIVDDLKDERIESENHHINIFFAEGYYVFNHDKFSLSAGLFADMVQKRSAGSLLVYANYYQSRYLINDILLAGTDVYRTQQASVGVGYGYNFSLLGGRLLFHFSAVPMFSVYSHLMHRATFGSAEEENDYNKLYGDDPKFYDPSDFGKSDFHVNAFARFATNFSFGPMGRYVLSLFINYRYNGYSNNYKLHINNQEADAQLNLGYRF